MTRQGSEKLPCFCMQNSQNILDCSGKMTYNTGSYGNFYLRKDFEIWLRNLRSQACDWQKNTVSPL